MGRHTRRQRPGRTGAALPDVQCSANRVSSIGEGVEMGEGYPVCAFNEATTGPVSSHAEEIDRLRADHPFVRST